MTSEQILRQVWGDAQRNETHYLRVLVGQLRKKFDERAANAKIITTIHGTGYLFTPEVV